MRIGYTIVDCHMGRLLVATTERGICAVHLGRNDEELEDCLRSEYPAAHIERNKVQLCNWVSSLLDYINGSQPHLDLPLDVQATAFQWRVWQELLTIPYGETRTYGEIAAAIGQPKAAGAVAQACHANRTVVIIPCHRAARQDGALGTAYRDREAFSKQALLENELEQARRDKRKSL
jgi:AraC family transcriptional regulator of adaptative response/methylated-DNA-[protein]-cysteine methyltransferase